MSAGANLDWLFHVLGGLTAITGAVLLTLALIGDRAKVLHPGILYCEGE